MSTFASSHTDCSAEAISPATLTCPLRLPPGETERLSAIIATQQIIATSRLDRDGLMQLIVERAQSLTQAQGAAFEFLEGEEMVYRACSGSATPFLGLRLCFTTSLSGQCVQTRRMLRCDDCETDTRVDRNACSKIGVRSMIVVPLFYGQSVVGVLKVMSPVPDFFTDSDVQTLELMAGLFGAVINQAAAFDAQREALRESEQQYRTLFETTPHGIVYMDAEENITHANPAALRLLGLSLDEITRRTPADPRWRAIREDGSDFPASERPILTAMRTGEAVRNVVLGVYNPLSAEVRWLLVNATPEFHPGEVRPYRAYVTFEDISARKMLEAERERSLAEALERAERDPLTGLLNHRAFHKRLEEETARVQREGTTLGVVMLDMDNFKFFNDVYGHLAGDEVLRIVANQLSATCRSYDAVARFGGDEFALLLAGVGSATVEEIEGRLVSAMQDLSFCPPASGEKIPIRISLGVSLLTQKSAKRNSRCQAAVNAADARLRLSKTRGTAEPEAEQMRQAVQHHIAGFSMLDALVTAVDNKDRYTRRHSEDVMRYCLMIARVVGMDEAAQHNVAIAALLHDVGKIGIADSLLRKPGKLTEEEMDRVRQHPLMGALLIGSVPGLEAILDAVRHHHERWDGQGYPDRLAGENCPPMARMLAVADAYSAMTTDRPYRKGMAQAEALSVLEAGAGTQWDAAYVDALCTALEQRNALM